MDKITMLGTGNAMTTECFNTCFIYKNECGKMLVDTGGGQQLVGQLRKAEINAEDISCVFLSHKHTDHILGLPWLMRMKMRSLEAKPLQIIAHRELCKDIETLLTLLLPELSAHIGKDVLITPVEHGECLTVLGRNFLFYDTGSRECTQFGFAMTLSDGEKFVFNGDVPFFEANREIMSGAKWLMHEAFSLSSDKKGKIKRHSSVAEAAQYAGALNAESLILVHGSDREIEMRKRSYMQEASLHFKRNIFVPYDLDSLEL